MRIMTKQGLAAGCSSPRVFSLVPWGDWASFFSGRTVSQGSTVSSAVSLLKRAARTYCWNLQAPTLDSVSMELYRWNVGGLSGIPTCVVGEKEKMQQSLHVLSYCLQRLYFLKINLQQNSWPKICFKLLIRFCHLTSLITHSLILSKSMDQKSEIANFFNYTGRRVKISSICLLVFYISFFENYWCFFAHFSDFTFSAVVIYVHEFYILISHKRIYSIYFGTFFILKHKFSENLSLEIHPPGNLLYKNTFKVHQGHSLSNFNAKWKQFKYVLAER